MRPNPASGTAYGVDGCRAGWFYFALPRSRETAWGIAGTMKELVSSVDDSDRVFVDIPIGLPDGPERRLCDSEARARLRGPRASSVFPAPVRAALAAETYEDARQISRRVSDRGLTRQTFAILPRIKEVDSLLQKSEKARRIVREIHPEICFWALAGGSPMRQSKKTGAGFDERFVLLEGVHPSVRVDFHEIRAGFRSWDLGDDDILDAMAAAITASADPWALRTLPRQPAKDSCGLPMEIVYRADASSVT